MTPLSKRSIAVVLALSCATVAVACGDDDESSSGSSGGSSAAKSAKTANLAFIYPTTEGNFAQEMALGAKAAADDADGVKLTEAAPTSVDGPKQVQLFQAATRTSKDGVAMMTLTPDLFLRPLLTASQQGVPLVAVDVPPPKGTEQAVKLLIGNSNVQIGNMLAESVLDKIPEDATGEVLIGTDTPGLAVLEQRNQGFKETMAKERPQLKMVTFNAHQSPTENFNTWSATVKAHPKAVALRRAGHAGGGLADAGPEADEAEAARRRL